jgi:hypothetical protein
MSTMRREQVARAARLLWLSAGISGACVLFAGLYVRALDGRSSEAVLCWIVFVSAAIFTVLCAWGGIELMVEGIGNDQADVRLTRSMPLDAAAASGLALLAIGSILLESKSALTPYGMFICWLGFVLLGASTPRFLFAYGALATFLRKQHQPGLARFARALGVFKFIYEGVWLGVCMSLGPVLLVLFRGEVGVGLLFGGLFGLFGFPIVWILMLVFHGLLWRAVR